MENCIRVTEDNILSVFQAVYSDKGVLCKIHDEIYGFINEDNRITLLNVETKQLYEECYILDYIGEHVICMHNMSMNLDFVSIMLKRNDFSLLYRSNKNIEQVGDIIYEQGQIMLLDTECNKKIFDLEGKQIGAIYTGQQFSIRTSDAEGLYIGEYKKGINTVTIFFKYNKGDKKIEVLKTVDEYNIKEIGLGLLLFTSIENVRDAFVYDIINNEKF